MVNYTFAKSYLLVGTASHMSDVPHRPLVFDTLSANHNP